MIRVSKYQKLLFALILSSLCGTCARATTFSAATCNEPDVAAAISSATAAGSGNTVVIPAGTCTWTSPLTTPASGNLPSITIIGAGSQSLVGGGDKTTIIDNINRTSQGDVATWYINTTLGTTVRISGMTFQQNNNGNTSANFTDGGLVRFTGTSQAVRFDHSHLNMVNGGAMNFSDQVYGVVDHCLFDMQISSEWNAIRFFSGTWGGGTNQDGNGSWADTTTLGSNRFVFVEDSTFNNGVANDGQQGARFVFRHNTMNSTSVQTHPTGGDGDGRGARAWEIYDNIFTAATGCTISCGNAFFMSSGTGVVWGNTATGAYSSFVSVHSIRMNNSTYTQAPTPNGWGYCSAAFTGVASNWDQNGGTGGCMDQPGQGVGDLLSGSFPNKVNTTSGAIAWPHQALEPVYEWLNTWTGSAANFWPVSEATAIVQNHDYYLHASPFTGASGVGSGLLNARPASCSPTVAYWATDTNTLYKCLTANTWTASYTPYPYPHPLVLASGIPIVPASSLSGTAQ